MGNFVGVGFGGENGDGGGAALEGDGTDVTLVYSFLNESVASLEGVRFFFLLDVIRRRTTR